MQGLNTSDRDEFLDAHRKRMTELKARREAIPLETVAITDPKNCPNPQARWNGCGECGDRGGIYDEDLDAVPPFRREYQTGECFRVQQWRRALARTGLTEREYTHSFAAWQQTPQNVKVYDALRAWEPGEDNGIYLLGETTPANPTGNGTGKSYALHALTIRLTEAKKYVKFRRTVDFLKELRGSYDEEHGLDEYQIIEDYSKIPVLLWDDLGKEALKGDWAAEKFYLVIDERSRRGLPIVISSNYALDQIEQRFGDNFGPAIASRLIGMCPVRLKLGGADWRMK